MKLIPKKSNYVLALVIAGLLAGGSVFAQGGGKGGDKGGGKNDRMERNDDRKDDRRDDRNDNRRDDRNDNRNDKRSSDRNNDRYEKGDRGDRKGQASGRREHFEDRHRGVVRSYYDEQYRGRRCPPGLAKKNNGCMPPGQARRWEMGRPLPREVIYYEVPQPLVVQIGTPPSGYRYVRVASDILMIAIGTGMVVDAIQDLGR